MEFTGGFAPDTSVFNLAALSECYEIIPSDSGMRSCPTGALIAGVGVLAAACRGAFSGSKMDGTSRTFAGTQTKLYELVGTTWTDRSSGGGSYTGSSTSRWMFAQFGDITLATDDVADIQAITTGNFAAIAGAPKARIVITVPNFAIAFNTQNGATSAAFGDSPDRWWCSAYQDPTDWAISAATQCVSERLIGSGGEITAAAPFGTGWVAYKKRDMFHAYYTGDASVFTTQRVPGNWGCVGPNAVADIGNAHFVVGPDDIYIYDGARPVSVASGKVRKWFFAEMIGRLDKSAAHLTAVRYDRAAGLVWVFYPGFSGFGTASNCDRALVYHLATGRWGYAVQAPANNSDSRLEEAFILMRTAGDVLAVFDVAHDLRTVDGSPISLVADKTLPYFTTNYFGDNAQATMLTSAQIMDGSEYAVGIFSADDRPRGLAATYTGAIGADKTVAFRGTAAWHRLHVSVYDEFEITGCEAYIQPAGGRAS